MMKDIFGFVTLLNDDEEHAEGDEELFREIPPQDCNICFLPLPILSGERTYKVCCGCVVCDGCIHAIRGNAKGRGEMCPFCREVSNETNLLGRIEKRVALNDPDAVAILAFINQRGEYEVPKSQTKFLSLLHRAAELGSTDANTNLGYFYTNGQFGLKKDLTKANHHFEVAAKNGSIDARRMLGYLEWTKLHPQRAIKHWKIAARAGDEQSLNQVKYAFLGKHQAFTSEKHLVTKKEYEETLRAFLKSRDSTSSDQREKARIFYQSRIPRRCPK